MLLPFTTQLMQYITDIELVQVSSTCCLSVTSISGFTLVIVTWTKLFHFLSSVIPSKNFGKVKQIRPNLLPKLVDILLVYFWQHKFFLLYHFFVRTKWFSFGRSLKTSKFFFVMTKYEQDVDHVQFNQKETKTVTKQSYNQIRPKQFL